MNEVKGGKLLAIVFALFAIVTLIADFSIYKFPYSQTLFFLLLLFLFFSSNRTKQIGNKNSILFLAGWAIVYAISFIINSSLPGFGLIISLIYGFLFLSLDRSVILSVFKYFVWFLTILLVCSLVEFSIFHLLGKGIVLGSVVRTTEYKSSYFDHLLFNIIRTELFVPRFQSLADEPGRLGTLCGLLLFPVWRMKNMRFPFFVILVGGIITFSLAYYILLVIFLVSSVRHSFKAAIVLLSFLAVVAYYLQDNLDYLILARFEETENVDNRTSEVFDSYFEKAIDNGDIWFGVGKEKLRMIAEESDGGNGGGKVWILQYGIISLIIVLLIYNLIYYKICPKKLEFYDWLFLLAFWLSFYQRQTVYIPTTMLAFFSMPFIRAFYLDQNIKE